MKTSTLFAIPMMLIAGAALAKVDLVTLPARDTVQLTIYNPADMTLVRESRGLTLQKGLNRLQFSWANTLIDPTSLEMIPKANGDKIDILDLTYPPRVRELGLWNIKSEVSGRTPMEITYLTSGFSWRAFYMGTLAPDEKTMRLEGFVRVTNNTGEDYENAQTRLIVGTVHMLDDIAALARRQYPFGAPLPAVPAAPQASAARLDERKDMLMKAKGEMLAMDAAGFAGKPKEIAKEGLSEYFLYTIEGTETIANGWAKRLPSFQANEVPVENLYEYEEERFGPAVVRFLSFKNDKDHKLGETPIPGGQMEVYRTADAERHLSYEGQSSFKYIPVDEDVELSLGAVGNVVVEPKLMDFKSDNYLFDNHGDVIGWDETRAFRFKVKNTRDVAVRVEVTRNFGTPHWDLKNTDATAVYEKIDLDTAKYTLALEPRSEKVFSYVLTTHLGRRAE